MAERIESDSPLESSHAGGFRKLYRVSASCPEFSVAFFKPESSPNLMISG